MKRTNALAVGQGVALLVAGIVILWRAGGMDEVVLGFAVSAPIVAVVTLVSWCPRPDNRG